MCKFKNEKLCEFHVKRLIEKKDRIERIENVLIQRKITNKQKASCKSQIYKNW